MSLGLHLTQRSKSSLDPEAEHSDQELGCLQKGTRPMSAEAMAMEINPVIEYWAQPLDAIVSSTRKATNSSGAPNESQTLRYVKS